MLIPRPPISHLSTKEQQKRVDELVKEMEDNCKWAKRLGVFFGIVFILAFLFIIFHDK